MASAMRSTEDKRGSRLLLSISDKCWGDMLVMTETSFKVRCR
jgi:hypothetical protein